MSNGGSDGIINAMFGMPRYGPAWFSIFMFGMTLLFVQQLPVNMSTYMIPSLVVYSLGTALLGTLHRLLGIHYSSDPNKHDEKDIPRHWKINILLAHSSWFVSFIIYNIYRDVL